MRAHFGLAVVCAALLPLVSLAATGAADPEPLTLAVVRQDGIIVPFATWTGKEWENSWPVPEKEADTPISTAEIPRRWWHKATGPLERWFVWQVDGTTANVQVTAPTWFPAHCQQGIGLRTSLSVRQPVPPPRVQPYPKIGIGMSRKIDLTAIEAVDPAGPVGTGLVKALQRLIGEDEDRESRKYLQSGWKHPYDDGERRRFPITIEALYRAPAGRSGVFMHYFEAVKRYPPVGTPPIAETKTSPRKPPPCELVTFSVGWLVARDGETSVTPSSWITTMTSCDFNTVDVMLPLGTLTLTDRILWIAQLSGWGRERYAVLDPSAPQERIVQWVAPGGTCSKRAE